MDKAQRLPSTLGAASTQLVRDLIPSKIPDLFEDDQLILLGQYQEDSPLKFRLHGNCLGKERTFEVQFDFDGATTRNAFVPRLWAARRIAPRRPRAAGRNGHGSAGRHGHAGCDARRRSAE